MRPYNRLRLEATIVRAVAEILEFEVKDPALRALFPAVVGARLSPGGEEATVAVAVDEGLEAQALAALRHDRGFIRAQLARKLALRRVPELRFVLARPPGGETGA